MIRNYKYKLYVNSELTPALSQLITSSNFAWNHIVMFARRYYKLYHKGVTSSQLQKHMAKLAKHNEFWGKLDSQTMQSISQKYDTALKQHFKQPKQRGFPRMHKKHKDGSILFKQSGYRLFVDENNHGYLIINKINKSHGLRFKITRPWGNVKTISVKRDRDNCLYLTVCCDEPNKPTKSAENNRGAIGIDFGLKTFITTSTGECIQIPDYHKQALTNIKTADRQYTRRFKAKVYGTSFKRARKAKFKTHRRVANLRSDFHWKTAHKLCKENAFIAIENLNLKGMRRHKRWGRKVSSLGIGEFIQKLQVVAEKYGTVVHKIDRFAPSSQICNECGYRNTETKNLMLREWKCPICGAYHDRDVNAAKNILEIACEKIQNGKGISRGKSDSKTSPLSREAVILTA